MEWATFEMTLKTACCDNTFEHEYERMEILLTKQHNLCTTMDPYALLNLLSVH